jgi:hypothetical protein
LQTYDLAIAWCWEYDADLICRIDRESLIRGLSPYLIHPHNLSETLYRMQNGEIGFRFFLDRASDQNEAFDQLVDRMKEEGVRMINEVGLSERAADKAVMQRELVSKGINVPKTIVLPSYDDRPEIRAIRLNRVGIPFVIKPACGACGDGVYTDARTIDDIKRARQEYSDDRYLIQEKIQPVVIDSRRAWFRVFYAFGEILPCWWDDQTKISDVLSSFEMDKRIYSRITRIVRQIARICKLELFSTEIALTAEGKLVVVDPVNDQIDLRSKSSHFDGIPDKVINGIVINMVNWLEKQLCRRSKRREPSLCKKV